MKNKRSAFWILLGVVVIVILIISNATFVTLEPGQRGIIFRKFSSGLDTEKIFKPGFHIIAPWNKLYIYDVREQQSEETMSVLDKNGLSLSVDITIRFNPLYDKIGYLHEVFGQSYMNRLIIPELRSAVRRVTGRYIAEEIYSTKRSEVEQAIISETKDVLSKNFVDMRALLIRNIILPDQLKSAIESKQTREQEALAMKFINEREKLEADRKAIEAQGIANYNKIINQSLTDKILKQKGIDATIKLSESENTKVIVIGSGKDGMPLILGGN